MITEFGKSLRILRIEREELLKDMADKLGVSSAYLSAVETGKRATPKDWVGKLVSLYDLPRDQAEEISQAYDMSLGEVTIQLQNTSRENHKVAVSFAKTFGQMSNEELAEIMNIIGQAAKKGGKSNCHQT